MSAKEDWASEEPWKPRIALGHQLQREDTPDTWVLLYPQGMVRLNQSAGEILYRCDGMHDLNGIIRELEESFGVRGIGPQVEGMLHEGARRGWVV